MNESVNTASIGDNKPWDQLPFGQKRYIADQIISLAPESAYADILRDEKFREKYDLNDKPCVKCGTMKPTCSLIKSSHLGGLACCDCVNALTLGDNKHWLKLPSSITGSHRSGFHQTLCADCKMPTPLNDMFPTGPDNIFKCWSCAIIIDPDPELADITD